MIKIIDFVSFIIHNIIKLFRKIKPLIFVSVALGDDRAMGLLRKDPEAEFKYR
jgi:hypothetical protein